ncbi:MAG: DUF1003 domain-containing protein [Candidatus Sericytochromatia bacterium]
MFPSYELHLLPPHLQQFLLEQGRPSRKMARYCRVCLNRFRHELLAFLMGKEQFEMDSLEKEVFQSILDHATVSENPEKNIEPVHWADQLSDQIARFGGSWRFILFFGAFIFCWILGNSLVLLGRPLDPFPYILLNLMLSCLAALQAPLIMMSQNRQEARDRIRSINDYQVNLKAELEIRQLHFKLDQLTHHQWQHLMQIQELQMEMLEELLEKNEETD